MKAKSSAHYQREYRRRLRQQGLVKKEVWILPENAKHLAAVEKQLRRRGDMFEPPGEMDMTHQVERWTTQSLFQALQQSDWFAQGTAAIEMIDGAEPALHVTMHEYGDLPLFLTVSGDQIIVESLLWPASDVTDKARFNDAVLRTHKYLPLSTISLDNIDGEDYYHMFGALSASSILSNVVFEIEVLTSNVIQATEAYNEFLTVTAAAG
ncbi:hypothetical protein CHH28_19075 [Bacterioplanes sanyensis]|uniref:DUF2170 domain-containing protein n=1 Tax=Bacterioplanes sanyensis TaxID=1249553 RepID=A0A222FNN1_9GAMM|nr:YjfI family protein [Bacterioplanes sanyensis]ASP40637.1 hypothetical protein CHH28_19075 [Bacterioplanes sanyensis]